ncbi:MAG TPA: trypsin-like peptidase domain-containing protein [Gemmataceae bacterium]|nr:trypsin-like peptidase domain-containing protein [Gemmataceae bacterium]
MFLVTCSLFLAAAARADQSLEKVVREVNSKLAKLYGSGGYKGLAAYGTGIVISPDGYILTVASQMLDTPDLRVHLADGRRFHGKVVVTEPNLDVALIKIDGVANLPYFDIIQAAQRPPAEPGTGVLAFSNQFNIAVRDEPMTVQRGVIAAYGKLPLRRGVFEVPYKGDVYVIDAISNNPGAAGGALTTRKGELLGLIGKELLNSLTDTWVNYAIPLHAQAEGMRDDKPVTVSLVELVEQKEKFKPLVAKRPSYEGPGGYHGIILVPNVVERTPPYVEDVIPGSPAARAGLKPDDLIVYVNGEQVGSIKVFREIVDRAPPGTTFKLEVRRGDKLTGIELKLEEPMVRTPVKKSSPPDKPDK